MRSQKGFTLIEMLIVIFIIGLLALMSVGAYTHYRKSAMVNLAADNVVSLLYKARQEVKSGKVFDEEEGSKCRGLNISVNDGEDGAEDFGGIKAVEMDYSSVKVLVKWVETGCVDESAVEMAVDLDDLVKVSEVSPEGNYTLMFVPPEGEFVFSSSSGLLETHDELEVHLKYGDDEESKYTRTILIDKKTGNATTAK